MFAASNIRLIELTKENNQKCDETEVALLITEEKTHPKLVLANINE